MTTRTVGCSCSVHVRNCILRIKRKRKDGKLDPENILETRSIVNSHWLIVNSPQCEGKRRTGFAICAIGWIVMILLTQVRKIEKFLSDTPAQVSG